MRRSGFLGEDHGVESRPGAQARAEGNRFQVQPVQGAPLRGGRRERSRSRSSLWSRHRPEVFSHPARCPWSARVPYRSHLHRTSPSPTRSRWLGQRSKARCGGRTTSSPTTRIATRGLLRRVAGHVNARGAPLYVQDVFAGSDPAYSVPYRFVGEYAVHAMFAHNMFPKRVSRGSRTRRTSAGRCSTCSPSVASPSATAATPTAPRSSTSATGSASSPGGPTTAGW